MLASAVVKVLQSDGAAHSVGLSESCAAVLRNLSCLPNSPELSSFPALELWNCLVPVAMVRSPVLLIRSWTFRACITMVFCQDEALTGFPDSVALLDHVRSGLYNMLYLSRD
jgi:hypothetical protein